MAPVTSAALLAATLLHAQLTTFEDAVRDTLGCTVDDDAVEALTLPGDSADDVAERLRSLGACSHESTNSPSAGAPRRASWCPSLVWFQATAQAPRQRTESRVRRERTWSFWLGLRWTLDADRRSR